MAKDLTEIGIFIGKGYYNTDNPNSIRAVHVYDMLDEESPDGISFVYDLFDILPNGDITHCDGACYWGYDSARDLLNDICDPSEMAEVFDRDVDKMMCCMHFDYSKLNQLLTSH